MKQSGFCGSTVSYKMPTGFGGSEPQRELCVSVLSLLSLDAFFFLSEGCDAWLDRRGRVKIQPQKHHVTPAQAGVQIQATGFRLAPE